MAQRSYDVRVVALTIDAPIKWVDNLLSHHEIPGCTRARQGVERKITDSGLRAIAIVRALNHELAIPLARCAALVRDAATDGFGALQTSGGIRIELPVERIEEQLRSRLIDALEAVPRVARGRPRAES